MKQLILLTIVLSNFYSQAQIPSYVPQTGLSAWYSFNNNANDQSSNAINLSNNGVVLSDDRFSNPNSAYYFSGVTNVYLNCVNPSNDLLNAGLESFSISVWFKTNSTGRKNTICHKRRMGGTSGLTNFEGYSFYLDTGYIVFTLEDVNSVFTNVIDSTNYDDGSWHHAVIIRDIAEDSIKLYVDGTYRTASMDNTTATTSSTSDFFIGKWEAYDDYGFLGDLDDVGVWKSALTECQVIELYTTQNCDASVIEINDNSKYLIQIIDLMGRETEFKPNTPLIYIYSDGTTEKVYRMD